MNKFLLTIEFRYNDAPKYHRDLDSRTKIVTIGVYDTFEDACANGNNLLEKLENRFDLHVFPSGIPASKERFSKNGGPFGCKNNLVANSAYLKTPFDFYAKITTLNYANTMDVVDDVLTCVDNYKKYLRTLND